jgi:hypothetical protein
MKMRQTPSRAGFTLIEVAISALVFVLLMGALGIVTTVGQSAYRTSSVVADLDGSARRALRRVADELTTIDGANMFPNPTGDGTDNLTFTQATGVVNGAVVWGPTTSVAFEYEIGEVDDGQDNDGDGLIDEGVLAFTRDVGGASEKRVVLCHNVREWAEGEIDNNIDDNGNGLVDEKGFNVQRVGDVLTLRLWLEGSGGGETTYVRQNQATVRLRNL